MFRMYPDELHLVAHPVGGYVASDACFGRLRQHWQRQLQLDQRQRLGDAYDTSLDLVFPNRYGGVMIPDNLAKRSFKQHLVAAGLPRSIRLHDFRHTAATLLLSADVNVKVVSEMLSHTDVGITLRVYAHVLPHMHEPERADGDDDRQDSRHGRLCDRVRANAPASPADQRGEHEQERPAQNRTLSRFGDGGDGNLDAPASDRQ